MDALLETLGRRFAPTVFLVPVLLGAAGVVTASTAETAGTDGWAACGEPEELRRTLAGLGRPSFASVHLLGSDAEARRRARAGDFLVDGRPVRLSPPVDWLQDPYSDRTWRFWLHSLVPLEPLLQAYDEEGDVAALRRAQELALDWIEHNPLGGEEISEFAWYDMAVAARAAYLAYLLRAGAHAGTLTPEALCRLAGAVDEHARWLAAEENYYAGHNHGLYEDGGLFLVALQLPVHPDAEGWSELATRRFRGTVAETVAVGEAVHLEHSPAYHVRVTGLLRTFSDLGLGGDELADLVRRMEANAGWFLMPDGELVQLGDTDRGRTEPWVYERGGDPRGLAVFPAAGFAAVREPPASHLVLAAGYHRPGHKHADELSFSLFDRGRRVVVDSGRYGYYYAEPGRRYATSSRGHNTLVVGEEFTYRRREPYGSGIWGGDESGGWYLLAGENPLLSAHESRHRRLLLYRPGDRLLVVDRVEAPAEETVSRFFHFAPELTLEPAGPGRYRVEGEGLAGRVCDASFGEGVVSRLVVGQREPEVQGFTFPTTREWRASPTAVFESPGSIRLLVTVIELGAGGACSETSGWSFRAEGEELEAAVRVEGPGVRLRAVAEGPGRVRLESSDGPG